MRVAAKTCELRNRDTRVRAARAYAPWRREAGVTTRVRQRTDMVIPGGADVAGCMLGSATSPGPDRASMRVAAYPSSSRDQRMWAADGNADPAMFPWAGFSSSLQRRGHRPRRPYSAG